MGDDPRYKYVYSVWAAGELTSFAEIFDIVPKSTVAADMGLNYGRFAKRVKHPGMLCFKETQKMAKLLKIDFRALVGLIVNDMENKPVAKIA
jgi:hypothetical protein